MGWEGRDEQGCVYYGERNERWKGLDLEDTEFCQFLVPTLNST